MAQHNPSSRAFLFIVLGGIVIGFVIAAFLLGGDDSETGAKMDKLEQPAAEQPAAETPPMEAPADDMSTDNTPPPEEIPMGMPSWRMTEWTTAAASASSTWITSS